MGTGSLRGRVTSSWSRGRGPISRWAVGSRNILWGSSWVCLLCFRSSVCFCLGFRLGNSPKSSYTTPPKSGYSSPPKASYSSPKSSYSSPQPSYSSDDSSPSEYSYHYSVPETESQAWEERTGYTTQGSYSVLLPDGRTMTVTYSVPDSETGRANILQKIGSLEVNKTNLIIDFWLNFIDPGTDS